MLECFHRAAGAVSATWTALSRRTAKADKRPRNAKVYAPEACEDRNLLAGVEISGLIGAGTINTQAHTTFVPALYTSVLNRQPDFVGMTVYQNSFLSGTTPNQVMNSIFDSSEHRGLQVDSFYQTYLGRTADASGRQHWIDQMLAGMTEEQVTAAFLVSDEYAGLHVTTEDFVEGLYNDILGRDSDGPGKAAWAGAIDGGTTKLDAITAFINCNERHTKIIEAYYQHYLLRPVDDYGSSTWIALMDAGTVDDQTLAKAILASGEFQAAHVLFGVS